MKNRKNKKGFTIVELVIVIGVIGILSAILIPTFVSLTAKAEKAALKSNLANAYSMYAADAADGKLDDDESVSLSLYGQSKIVLTATKNASSISGYNYTSEGWAVEAASYTVGDGAGKYKLVVDHSYLDYFVYYLQ